MKNDSKTPHMGMIVALGVLIAAIWMLAIYDTIQDAHEEKYDVSVRPGAVSYGTHSSATVPMVSAPTRHTAAPMISGRAVRSYAHYGHASYAHNPSPVTAIHTTSSATVHTIGSGNGGGGGTSSSHAGGKGGSRGIAYGGGSVSMPSLALATTSFASSSAISTAEAARHGSGPRRVRPDDRTGTVGTWQDGGDGDWWYNDEGTWIEPWVTASRPAGDGNFWQWNGEKWVLVDDQGDPVLPATPLGDAPWHWMLLLALGYGIVRMIRTKHVFRPKVG